MFRLVILAHVSISLWKPTLNYMPTFYMPTFYDIFVWLFSRCHLCGPAHAWVDSWRNRAIKLCAGSSLLSEQRYRSLLRHAWGQSLRVTLGVYARFSSLSWVGERSEHGVCVKSRSYIVHCTLYIQIFQISYFPPYIYEHPSKRKMLHFHFV